MGVSHDLRTPLTRIRLAIEMLKEQPDKSMISKIENEIINMDGIIAQFLTLARGLNEEQKESVILYEIIFQWINNWQTESNRLILKTEDNFDQSIHAVIQKNALHQVVHNLVENALKFSEDDVVINLTKRKTDETYFFTIELIDRGIGIEPSNIAVIFEPFKRLEPSRSQQTGGSG